uniref:FZ domain-containing protein n=1 Tax=Heterorhabditis bacteriophora TaxID=37862 RepID=A0A1I7XDX2_HETBA
MTTEGISFIWFDESYHYSTFHKALPLIPVRMAAWCAENLRDCEGWRSCGLPLSSPSNECCRLFDGALRQVVSWSDCSQLGGIHVTMKNMLATDPKAGWVYHNR